VQRDDQDERASGAIWYLGVDCRRQGATVGSIVAQRRSANRTDPPRESVQASRRNDPENPAVLGAQWGDSNPHDIAISGF